MLSKRNEIRERKNLIGHKVRGLREEIIREKIKKATNRDMYSDIYQPITKGIESQKEELLSQLKELKALPRIQEQLALLPREFVNKIQEAEKKETLSPSLAPLTVEELPEEDISKMFEDYEKERAEELPEEESSSDEDFYEAFFGSKDLGARPKKKTIPAVNLDADIDLNVIRKSKQPKPSEMFNFYITNKTKSSRDFVEKVIDDVTENIKKLNGPIAGKSKSEDPNIKKEVEQLRHERTNLIKYRGRLKGILDMGPTYGMGFKHKYKVSPTGQYGNLIINLNKLYSQNKLVAQDKITGKIVMNMKVDDDFIDLIGKRYNNNKEHSLLSVKIFKELTEKSGLPINERSMKFQKVIRQSLRPDGEIKGQGFNSCSCDPKQLMDNLELICGSIEAGNNNQELINDGIGIIDELLKTKVLSPEKHEILYKKYFLH